MENSKGILLEAGTNEMELLVFKLGETPFGINVAKIREIIQQVPTINIPYSPAAVAGSFKLRNQVLTLVDLGYHFSMQGDRAVNNNGMIIIVEFNNIQCGILVDAVERIHRLRWDQIQAPSQYLKSLEAPVTGVVNIDKQIVLVADFETIIGDILGVESAVMPEIESHGDVEPSEAKILLCDDSSVIRTSLIRILENEGFTNLTVCTDGQDAWDTIAARKGNNEELFDLVLSDIEMPRMDGLHLTSKIKQDPQLSSIPVVLFSSLISTDNTRKCEAVGANAQVSKPDSLEMINSVKYWLAKSAAAKQPVSV
jgi:two-component system chemotaxis response regulator CheV